MAGRAPAGVRRPQPGVRGRGGAARVVPGPRRRGIAGTRRPGAGPVRCRRRPPGARRRAGVRPCRVEAVARIGGPARARVDALGWDVHGRDHDGGLRHHVTITGGGTTGTVTGTTVVVAPLGVVEPGELHERAAKTMPTSTSTPATALPMMLRELGRRTLGCVIRGAFLGDSGIRLDPGWRTSMMRAFASIGQLRDRPITVRERRARLDGMPRTRRSIPLVACAVGLVLIGWGVVRTADSAQRIAGDHGVAERVVGVGAGTGSRAGGARGLAVRAHR